MTEPQKTHQEPSAVVSHDDLLRIVGDIDDSKLLAILDLQPTVAEVEEAAIWFTGGGDVLDRSGHPLTGVVASIFEILNSEEEEPPIPR